MAAGMWKALVACLLLAIYCQLSLSYSEKGLRKEIKKLMLNTTVRRDYHKRFQQSREKVTAEFPCQPLAPSPSVPTSVHKLRPSDVNVVAAMGDSLTAGSGITAVTVFGVLIENRGLTWSMGGEGTYEEQATLPNILKKYNPSLTGYSTGDGGVNSENAGLNVAEPGFESIELEGETRLLIDRMKADSDVDFENDWKVITIMIGDNDLCEYCNNREEYTAEKYKSRLQKSLDMLHAEVPRAFVNLVEPLNIEIATELNKGLLCSGLHLFLCNCAAFPEDDAAFKELQNLTRQYQDAAAELALSGRYDTRDDFTVVAQPFFRETYLPREPGGDPDLSFFAPDCFHLTRKGQAAAAEGLWNNMIEPIHEKRQVWSPGEPVECPTEEFPYFYTNKNNPGLLQSERLSETKLVGADNTENLQERSQGNGNTSSDLTSGTYVTIALFSMLGLAAMIVLFVVFRRRASYHKL